MAKLIDIEGIGDVYREKLNSVGVATVEDLLKKGATTKDRKDLAGKTGINDALILKWVNCADLFRIKGVGTQYSALLEAAGVDTVSELAQRKAENLAQKLVETNATKKLVGQLPTQAQIADWIEQAKKLPKVVTF